MAFNMRYVELAKQLHPRLQRFFAKYPPNQILPATTRTNTAAIEGGATTNPFLPHKHPATGKWHDPEFSLRRQAELVKLARESGVEELLPFTNKGTEERIRVRVEHGLRVRGTGVGQKVKGHLYERMLATKYVLYPPSFGAASPLLTIFRP
jgi:large subunit ribosomal protein L25